MSKEKKSSFQTVSLVILITLVGKVLGLGRDMLMGHTFGTGWEADALSTASRIPRLFFDAVFASAISSSFIPVFNDYMEREGREAAFSLSSAFLTVVGVATALLTGLGMAFSPQLVGLMANFDGETAALCAALLRIIFPSLFFTGIAFSMVGILQSLGEFNAPAAMSIASNGILIVYYLFFVERFGVYGVAVALLLGWGAQALIQMPGLRKRGYRYRPRLRHRGLGQIFTLMLPVMVSTWIQPINLAINTKFASGLTGGVSGIEYANTLYTMIAGIFVLSVTNVIFPEMSRLTAAGSRGELGETVRSTTRTLLFLLIPMTVGLMLLAEPLVKLLYEYRNFGADSSATTASALFFMALGMAGYGVQNVLVRVFYAEKNGKIPLISGAVSILVNLLLCALLVDAMGIPGLALASAVSLTVAALLLVPPAHRVLEGGLLTRALLRALGKMLVAAGLMGVLVFLLREGLGAVLGTGVAARLAWVCVPAAAGLGAYMGIARLLRIDEAAVALRLFKNLRKRGG